MKRLFAFLTVLVIGAPVFAAGDFSPYEIIPSGQVQVDVAIRKIDDGIDVLNLRDDAFDSKTASALGNPGDWFGGAGEIRYGLTDFLTGRFQLSYDSLDYGFDDLNVMGFDGSVTVKSPFPFIGGYFGIRGHYSDTSSYDTPDEVNSITRRMGKSNWTVDWDTLYLSVEKKTEDGFLRIQIPRAGRPDPEVSLESMSDQTVYGGIWLGEKFGRFSPYAFAEYGKTWVTSEIDTTLDSYTEAAGVSLPLTFPVDLDRDETYYKYGLAFHMELTKRFAAKMEYARYKFDRDAALTESDYNSSFIAELQYAMTETLAFRIGGTYFERQLSGIIPLLYNQYTMTTFDHQYGVMHAGITWTFNGF